MNRHAIITLSAGALLAVASTADAAFMSNFEAFSSGTALQNVGGWKGWDGVASAAGVVSDLYAYAGSGSLEVHGYTDAVRQYAGITSGVWSLDMKQYIPSGQTGLTYVIVMNDYIDGGNTNSGQWSTQLKFDLGAGTVHDDFRAGTLPIVTDQWADVRIDVDLDADTVSSYYNGALISAGTWTRNGVSQLAVSALDLYSNADNYAYYDNVALTRISVPSPGAPALCLFGTVLLLPRGAAKKRTSSVARP